jgi:hypothetical protein
MSERVEKRSSEHSSMTMFGQKGIRKKNSLEKRVIRLNRIIPKSNNTVEPINRKGI